MEPARSSDPSAPDLTAEDRTLLLDNTAWCRDFTWAQLETLARYLGVRRAGPGEVLVREHGSEAYLGIVVSGRLEVRKRGEAGVYPLAALGAGASFGEMALLDGQPRSASVVAAAETVVLVLRPDSLDRLTRDHPRLAAAFYRKLATNLSAHLRRTSGRLVDCVAPDGRRPSAPHRLAATDSASY